MPTTNSPKADIVPVRVTPVMRRQIDELVAAGHGNANEVIRTAVDRMYQQERGTMNAKQIEERIETLTVRMDTAARKSSANPVIQERFAVEVDELWTEIQALEAQLKAQHGPF